MSAKWFRQCRTALLLGSVLASWSVNAEDSSTAEIALSFDPSVFTDGKPLENIDSYRILLQVVEPEKLKAVTNDLGSTTSHIDSIDGKKAVTTTAVFKVISGGVVKESRKGDGTKLEAAAIGGGLCFFFAPKEWRSFANQAIKPGSTFEFSACEYEGCGESYIKTDVSSIEDAAKNSVLGRRLFLTSPSLGVILVCEKMTEAPFSISTLRRAFGQSANIKVIQ